MPGKQFSPQDQTDMIWVCRRLAAALQGGETVVSVLDDLSRSAPKGPRRILSAMRDSLAGGKWASDALLTLGMPWYVLGALKGGELGSRLGESATALAERLELERGIAGIRNRELLAYSLAFGRLGLLLGIHVPILTAIEAAAGSVPGANAEAALNRAREEVRQGVDLSEALERAGAALPEMTLQMIRDGEEDSRLHHALSVVSDYLLDEAGAASRAKKEV
jgi:type II secretory pathway component PulF